MPSTHRKMSLRTLDLSLRRACRRVLRGLGKKSPWKNFDVCATYMSSPRYPSNYTQNRRRIRFEHMYSRLWTLRRRVDLNITWSSNYRKVFYQYINCAYMIFFLFYLRYEPYFSWMGKLPYFLINHTTITFFLEYFFELTVVCFTPMKYFEFYSRMRNKEQVSVW